MNKVAVELQPGVEMSRRRDSRVRGVIRDRKTGVVTARKHRHPLQQLLTSIPNAHPDYPDADLPPFQMPDEMKQVIAVHLFDNLYPGLPLPPGEGETWTVTSSTGEAWTIDGARYRLVNPTGDTKPHGGNGEVWLPWAVPADTVAVTPVDVDGVPDVDDLDDAQFAALQQRIEDRVAAEATRDALDPQARPSDAEWVRWRKARRGEVAE